MVFGKVAASPGPGVHRSHPGHLDHHSGGPGAADEVRSEAGRVDGAGVVGAGERRFVGVRLRRGVFLWIDRREFLEPRRSCLEGVRRRSVVGGENLGHDHGPDQSVVPGCVLGPLRRSGDHDDSRKNGDVTWMMLTYTVRRS